ncbi:hypothetical protein COOONC_17026 [Cooperia oncophora]
MSTSAVLVLALSAVFAYADQDVKNATAAGSYGYDQPYNEPSYAGGFNYPPFYNGQYGPYGPYGPYGTFGPNFDVLKNSGRLCMQRRCCLRCLYVASPQGWP